MSEALRDGTYLKNRYRILSLLGQGGFAYTYLCEDTEEKEKVVLKELFLSRLVKRGSDSVTVELRDPKQGREYERAQRRFHREWETLENFKDDPVIVHVYELFEENGTCYLVMEYIEGKPLSEMEGKLPAQEAFRLILPVLHSLGRIHEKKLLHRDFSPGNVMVDPEGKWRLIDFGAVIELTEEEKRVSRIVKEGYAPIEQWGNESAQGPWTDLYAVGATLYKVITGITPPGAVGRSLYDELVTPEKLGIDIDEALQKILLKCMEISPQDRYQTSAELEEAILPALNAGKVKRKNRRIVAGILCICALAAGILFMRLRYTDLKEGMTEEDRDTGNGRITAAVSVTETETESVTETAVTETAAAENTASETIVTETAAAENAAAETIVTETAAAENTAAEAIPQYRLYNPFTGEHFYTGNITERGRMEEEGWVYEEIGWYAYPASFGDRTVYRLYNPKEGAETHYYTRDLTEIRIFLTQGWTMDGPVFCSEENSGVPVYRLYNPHAHNLASALQYTVNEKEIDILIGLGWRFEGIVWYGVRKNQV